MKVSRLFSFLLVLACATACQQRQESNDEVVCQTVHRYGVALEPSDWSSRGQNGQIVSMRKDGVAVMRNYDNGILHGECTYTYPYREVIQKREEYCQGDLKSECLYYHNGCPQKQITYASSGSQFVTGWYENSAPYFKETIENGRVIQGEYIHHDQYTESSVEEGNGIRTCRDGQGQLQSMDTIQNGNVRLSTTYHLNGAPAAVTPYSNGVVDGERRTYLPGGEPATIEMWKNNLQNGMTTIYEYGEKRADVPYFNGNRHGVERRYCDDGATVVQEFTWVNGQKHGPVYTYIGNTTKTDWYFCNRPVPNKATFDMLSNQ